MEEKQVEEKQTEKQQINEEQAEGKQNKKVSVALITVIAVLVVVIIAGVFVIIELLNGKEEPTVAVHNIGMEANIVANEEDAANVKINEPFSFTTFYKRDIYITDGDQASCFIGNSESNYYEDMYIQVFLNDEDDQPAEEIYVSKIIPPGSHIESFETNRKLESGDYRGTLVHSCINEEGGLVGDTAVVVDIHVSE